jgi:competence ComEA-like helix-hairpin-helix protein
MRNRRTLALSSALLMACLIIVTGAFAGKTLPPPHSIDLNAATIKELEELPGVGPTTAKAIVQFRTKSGRLHRVEDLLAIRGISEAKLQKIRPYVTLGPTPPPPPKPAVPKKPGPNEPATTPTK